MRHVSEADIAEEVERIKAERVAKGLPPTIQSPHVYRLLDAVLASHAEREKRQTPERD